MRVALIHDWLFVMRGGEKVLQALARLFPQAELFTLLAERSCFPEELARMKLHTSWLQHLPGVRSYYRQLLPWMPAAIERFDLAGFDLVISSSHCVAKGVRVPAGIPHLCYCHTPMRYAWHLQELYVSRVPRLLQGKARSELLKLRDWDRRSAERVTHFIANGKTVQQRIKDSYGRDSVIIHPPVDTSFYVPDNSARRENYYLVVSALAPNKRIDLAIQACQQLNRELKIIGSGEEASRLKHLAGLQAAFLGWCSNELIREHFQKCRALLFPGEEDFGIVPLEAQACGCPVIAYARGGATETVIPLEQPDPTGVWFMDPDVTSLVRAMNEFEHAGVSIRSEACRLNAESYGCRHFDESFTRLVSSIMTPPV